MEVHMTNHSKQERGKVMPILMAMVGIINIVQFFYKSVSYTHLDVYKRQDLLNRNLQKKPELSFWSL